MLRCVAVCLKRNPHAPDLNRCCVKESYHVCVRRMLQSVAVCYCVLRCVAVCCGVSVCLQRDPHAPDLNRYIILTRVNESCHVCERPMLQSVAVCRSMSQCVAVCCSVLQCVYKEIRMPLI